MKRFLKSVCATAAVIGLSGASIALAEDNDQSVIADLSENGMVVKIDSKTGKVVKAFEVTSDSLGDQLATAESDQVEGLLAEGAQEVTDLDTSKLKIKKAKKNTGRSDSTDVAWGYIYYGYYSWYAPVYYYPVYTYTYVYYPRYTNWYYLW